MQPRLRQLDFQRLRCQQRADARFVQSESFRAKLCPPADALVCVGDWDERHTSGHDSSTDENQFEPTEGREGCSARCSARGTLSSSSQSYTTVLVRVRRRRGAHLPHGTPLRACGCAVMVCRAVG